MMQNSNITPEMEDQMIELAYQNLLNGYLSSNHRKKVEIIDKAFKFARDAHQASAAVRASPISCTRLL